MRRASSGHGGPAARANAAGAAGAAAARSRALGEGPPPKRAKVRLDEPAQVKVKDLWPGGPEAFEKVCHAGRIHALRLPGRLAEAGKIAPNPFALPWAWPSTCPDAVLIRDLLAEFAAGLAIVDVLPRKTEPEHAECAAEVAKSAAAAAVAEPASEDAMGTSETNAAEVEPQALLADLWPGGAGAYQDLSGSRKKQAYQLIRELVESGKIAPKPNPYAPWVWPCGSHDAECVRNALADFAARPEPPPITLADLWPDGPEAYKQLSGSRSQQVHQVMRNLVESGKIAPRPRPTAPWVWPSGSQDAECVRNALAEFAARPLITVADLWPDGPEAYRQISGSRSQRVHQVIRSLVDSGKIAPRPRPTAPWVWPTGSQDAECVRNVLAEVAARPDSAPKVKAESAPERERGDSETTKLGDKASVWLADGGPGPPPGLLPADATVWVAESGAQMLQAEAHDATLAEAVRAGREAWAGLGEVPEGLPEDFRLVLFCGDSGSGKTSSLRALLRERFRDALRPGAMVTVRERPTQARGLDGVVFPAFGQIAAVSGEEENHGGGPGRVFSVRLEAAPETVLGGLSEGQVELAVLPEFGAATWGKFRPLLSAFQTAAEGMDCLGAAGLSSVPAWLGPHEVLSQGQRYRANLAMLLARRRRAEQRGETIPVGLDEFTSELDRPVAQAVALALRKRIAREGSRGWMLATCNADIIPCLQPEYLVVCRAGQRPLLVRGGASSIPASVVTELATTPAPAHRFVGIWQAGEDTGPLRIGFSDAPAHARADVRDDAGRQLQLTLDGIYTHLTGSSGPDCACKPDGEGWLLAEEFRDPTKKLKDRGGNWSDLQLRLWVRPGADADCLEVCFHSLQSGGWTGSDEAWRRETAVWGPGEIIQCRRIASQFGRIDLDLVPEGVPVRDAASAYTSVDLQRMRARGWYVPADLEPSRFPGLRIQSTEVLAEPFVFSKASSNRLKNRPPDGRSWLAAYVGRPDASEAEGIEYAESLLDEPFDGLCTHLIPSIAPIGAGAGLAAPNVQLTVPGSLGVIVGPAGSGKSSFARFWLGMPARAEWGQGSVLSHFQSPDAATAALSAAALSTSTATAPHAQLSRGEQSRADVARALAALAQGLKPEALSRPMCPEARTPALVLEEFTSLLDRATAQRVAAGVSRFLRALPAASGRPALVVVTCHEDLVGAGRLEPDWVFETRPGKLSLLRPASPPGPLPSDSDIPAGEGARLRGVATPCRTPSPDEDAAAAALASAAAAAAPPPIGKATPTGPSAAQASAAAAGPTDWLAAPLCLERVRLEVRRALPCEWAHFREHHYKDHTLVASAVGWVGLLAGRPVGCTFAVNLAPNYVANGRLDRCPQRSFQKRTAVENEERWLALPLSWARRPGAREHRTVVHPDFQGCSLGSALSDAVAREHELQGWLFASKTAHPHFGSYRDRSPFWAPCPNNGVAPKSGAAASFHHFWVGAVRPDGTTDPEREGKLAARMVDGRIRAAGGA